MLYGVVVNNLLFGIYVIDRVVSFDIGVFKVEGISMDEVCVKCEVMIFIGIYGLFEDFGVICVFMCS